MTQDERINEILFGDVHRALLEDVRGAVTRRTRALGRDVGEVLRRLDIAGMNTSIDGRVRQVGELVQSLQER